MNEPASENARPFDTLTSRESDILALLCEGLSDQEIADRLVIAYSTVKWYNRQIFNKMGVENRRQAILRAKELRLHETPPPPEAIHTSPTIKSNLPLQTTPFVGRRRERGELVHLITQDESRLLTIIGPGGMGKSRLALSVAEAVMPHFPDGVFFVPLASIHSPEEGLSVIVESTHFQIVPDDRTPHRQLIDFLASKSLLLILDNFEHVLEATSLVADILQSAPDVVMLVTSRERLNLSGETAYLLTGMDYPTTDSVPEGADYSALQLFNQCARRARPSFRLLEDLPSAIDICRLTQGMPLAIELAAAWASTLSTAEIAEEITRSLDFLQTTLRDVPERLRSIRAVFESTWKGLSEPERHTFAQLAVFRGGFTREAAGTVAHAELRTLTGLVNKALLWRVAETRRYEIHELLRQYAEEQLQATGEVEIIGLTYSHYYLNLLHQHQPKLESREQLEVLNAIEQDLDNLRAAWSWAASHQDYAVLLGALRPFWHYFLIRGHHFEGISLFEQTADQLRRAPQTAERDILLGLLLAHESILRADFSQKEPIPEKLAESRSLLEQHRALETQAFLALAEGWPVWAWKLQTEALFFLKPALEMYRELHDTWGITVSLYALGMSYLGGGKFQQIPDLPQARALLLEANTILQKSGDLHLRARVCKMQGLIAMFSQDYDEAERMTQVALELNRQSGNMLRVAGDLNNLSLCALFRNNITESDRYLEESLAVARHTGSPWGMTLATNNLVNNALVTGRYARAEAFANQLYTVAQKSGASHILTEALINLASALWPQGRFQEIEGYLKQQISMSESEGEIEERCFSLLLLSDLHFAQGDIEAAHRDLDTVSQLADEAEYPVIAMMSRKNRGVLLCEQGDYVRSSVLLHESLTFFQSEIAGQIMSHDWAAEQTAMNLAVLGHLEATQGYLESAWQFYHDGLTLTQGMPHKPPIKLRLLAYIAAWLASQGQLEYAAEMAAQVSANSASHAVDKMRVEKLLVTLQTQLPADAFSAAAQRGQTQEPDALVSSLLSS